MKMRLIVSLDKKKHITELKLNINDYKDEITKMKE